MGSHGRSRAGNLAAPKALTHPTLGSLAGIGRRETIREHPIFRRGGRRAYPARLDPGAISSPVVVFLKSGSIPRGLSAGL